MKKLSKLDLAAKVKILNENEMKHLKGGYGGSCGATSTYNACYSGSMFSSCCWTEGAKTFYGSCVSEMPGSSLYCRSVE